MTQPVPPSSEIRRLGRIPPLLAGGLAMLLAAAAAAAGCAARTLAVADDDGGAEQGIAPDLRSGPDLPPATSGKLVGGSFVLMGITDDNQVIATDQAHGYPVVAVPPDGNQPTPIGPTNWTTRLRGWAVITWLNVKVQTGLGDMTMWSAAAGQQEPVSGEASVWGVAAVSPDGNWIGYSGHSAADGRSTDLLVARADTTGSIRYATGAQVDPYRNPTTCSSSLEFSARNELVSLVCGKTNSLVVVDPATGRTTTPSSNIGTWMVLDPTGSYAAAADPKKNLLLLPLSGAAPILVDASVTGADRVAFLPDGSALVYLTDSGVLRRATVGNTPAPVTLVPANVAHLWRSFVNDRDRPAVSPDGRWLLLSTQYDVQTGDLYLASTATPGPPLALVSTGAGAVFGDAFSQDSRFVLYFSETEVVGNYLVGTLNARPVAGGAAKVIGRKVTVAFSAPGGVVAYNDNYKAGGHGRADLELIVLETLSPFPVSPQAEADFFPTRDRRAFVYSTMTSGPSSGIYRVAAMLP